MLSFVRHAVLIVGIAAVAACSAAAPAAPGTSTPPTSASAAASSTPSSARPSAAPTTAAAGTPVVTASASARPTAAAAQVDLTFTGSHPFTAKGSAGRCMLGTPAGGGLPLFGFEATEADYPGLAKSFSLLTFGQQPEYVDLKWVLDNGGYGRPENPVDPTDLTLSADHHTVTLDVDLDQFGPQGGPLPGAEHVSGTISCP